MFTNSRETQRGFSLIEMMVAVSLFAVFMVTALGALLAVVDANTKAQTLKLAINNLNYNLEKMSRDIRSGRDFYCGDPAGSLPVAVAGVNYDCPAGETAFAFRSKFNGNTLADYTMYRLNTGTRQLELVIYDASSNSQVIQPFVSDQVTFTSATFFVSGSDPSNGSGADNEQPTVLIALQGTAGAGRRVQSTFSIQTSISRRALDVGQ